MVTNAQSGAEERLYTQNETSREKKKTHNKANYNYIRMYNVVCGMVARDVLYEMLMFVMLCMRHREIYVCDVRCGNFYCVHRSSYRYSYLVYS